MHAYRVRAVLPLLSWLIFIAVSIGEKRVVEFWCISRVKGEPKENVGGGTLPADFQVGFFLRMRTHKRVSSMTFTPGMTVRPQYDDDVLVGEIFHRASDGVLRRTGQREAVVLAEKGSCVDEAAPGASESERYASGRAGTKTMPVAAMGDGVTQEYGSFLWKATSHDLNKLLNHGGEAQDQLGFVWGTRFGTVHGISCVGLREASVSFCDGSNGTLSPVDTGDMKETYFVASQIADVTALAVSPTGDALLVGTGEGHVRVLQWPRTHIMERCMLVSPTTVLDACWWDGAVKQDGDVKRSFGDLMILSVAADGFLRLSLAVTGQQLACVALNDLVPKHLLSGEVAQSASVKAVYDSVCVEREVLRKREEVARERKAKQQQASMAKKRCGKKGKRDDAQVVEAAKDAATAALSAVADILSDTTDINGGSIRTDDAAGRTNANGGDDGMVVDDTMPTTFPLYGVGRSYAAVLDAEVVVPFAEGLQSSSVLSSVQYGCAIRIIPIGHNQFSILVAPGTVLTFQVACSVMGGADGVPKCTVSFVEELSTGKPSQNGKDSVHAHGANIPVHFTPSACSERQLDGARIYGSLKMKKDSDHEDNQAEQQSITFVQ